MKDEMITAEYQEQRMEREDSGLQDAEALYGIDESQLKETFGDDVPVLRGIKQKVFEIRNTIGKISKDKENPFYNSAYFDINSLLDHLQSYLHATRILLTQPVESGCVVTRLECLETGQVMESSMKLPELSDPQKMGSAVTYYRRYTLKSLLAISEEDDDGNKTVKTKKSDIDDKKWLNATNKDGSLNKTGEATARKLKSGKTTWKDIYNSVKVSGKDKEAIESRVKEL